jgi:cytochrome d ubiquinol oxidase subunit I
LTRFWLKIFAFTFGIGVGTGIIMEFGSGTNWAVYSRHVGDIFGSALAAEGLFAFGLEGAFLGILLFGWNRLSSKVLFISTKGVFLGPSSWRSGSSWACLSLFWLFSRGGTEPLIGSCPL